MPLLLVQAFVNSVEADADTDLLREPDSARSWLAAAGLVEAGVPVGPEDLPLAREVREGIRALLIANADATVEPGAVPSPGDLEPLAALARDHRPRLRVDPGGHVHLDTDTGLAGAWLRLLIIIRDAQADGSWARLKACENDECRWAFYDRSHSRRGRWCDMAVCGNRMKNRDLRARRRHARRDTGGSSGLPV
jgi:predicted RNA-binding Zn ribbon-like protein